jgi:hypothetical protein
MILGKLVADQAGSWRTAASAWPLCVRDCSRGRCVCSITRTADRDPIIVISVTDRSPSGSVRFSHDVLTKCFAPKLSL